MNLISCTECAVVLDEDRINFPQHIHDEDGNIDEKKATWFMDDYYPKTDCPVCGTEIIKDRQQEA